MVAPLRRERNDDRWRVPAATETGALAPRPGPAHLVPAAPTDGLAARPPATLARQAEAAAALGIVALREPALEALLQRAVALVAETLGVEFTKVLELRPDGETLLLRAGVGWRRGRIGHATVGTGRESQAGFTLVAAEPVMVADLAQDQRFSAPPLLTEHRVVAGISTVIHGEHGPWGILGAHTRRHRTFFADEIDFVQSVANILGAAIERGRVEDERRAATAFLETLVEAAPLALLLLDVDGRVRLWSRGAERLFGWSAGEVLGQRSPLVPPDEEASTRDLRARVLGGETLRGLHLQRRRKDGTPLDLAVHGAPIRDAQGHVIGLMVAMADLTEHLRLEATLEAVRRDHDALTASVSSLHALATPEANAARICEEVARWPEFDGAALYAVTADGGLLPLAVVAPRGVPAPVGRPVPRALARALRTRAEVGPWVEDWGRGSRRTAVERAWLTAGLRGAAYAPLRRGDRLIGLLVGGTAEQLGTDRLARRLPTLSEYASVATALLGDQLVHWARQSRTTDALRALIEERRFDPVFQPIVELVTRAPVGWEALTRFADGRSPTEVFAEAEAAGLGQALELACLAEALRAADRLPDAAWLSLNVSPGLILTSDALADALRASPRPVVLEVTEHARIDEYGPLRAALGRLPFGTRVAVDDAGAGYAGLQQILELRPDFVKLDLALVRGIDRDLARQALVAGMVHFATAVGCTLIAEGVETEAEAAVLRTLGVRHAQGYLFGKPARFLGAGRAGPERQDASRVTPAAAARAARRAAGGRDAAHPASIGPARR